MSPKIDVINLGVNDPERARQFYEGGLGATVGTEDRALVVNLGPNASRLALREWEVAAREAGVEARSSGFRAFTLSYILESAVEVDQILARAERHGGRISKPPKNAVWGYSAYVTDPSGYLWKVASSKRHPFLGRKAPTTGNGRPVKPQEVPITIGVADMKRAREFYEEGIGMPVKKAYGTKFVMFSGEGGTSDLGMYKREALAKDAAVQPDGSGFHGFSLVHTVDSAERVDAFLERAMRAGAEVVKSPGNALDGTYGGSFADLDGNVWQIASHD